MKKQHYVALAMLLLVIGWLIVPRPTNSSDAQEEGQATAPIRVLPADAPAVDESQTFVVRAAPVAPAEYVENVRVRGRTQAIRMVDVRAEISGRVVATPVARGARVRAGDTLCELAVDTRAVDLQEARSREEQTRLEFNAAQDLARQGLQSQVVVAQARSAHESALAAVERAELALTNTHIKAPFDGIVEARPVDVGDFLDRGAVCASVLDDDPMLLVGMVPEQDISKVSLGSTVAADLLTGERVSATVTYVGRSADAQSRSYRIEAEVADGAPPLRDGITTEMRIAAAQVRAHRIPASALTLDDNGLVGVKLLGTDGRVSFAAVDIIGDDTSQLEGAIWVTGLDGTVNLITHGQEIVFAGQRVDANFGWATGNR